MDVNITGAPIRWLATLMLVLVVSDARADIAVSEIWRQPHTGDLYALPAQSDSNGRAATIHLSDDEGQSWRRMPGVPDGTGGELAVRTFAVIPSSESADIVFAGTGHHGLYRSVDDGQTWSAWNDAAIGIDTILVASKPGEAAWALSSDGAVYVSLDDGANWTLVADIAGKTVTAIANSDGDTAWVGTASGELIELAQAGTTVTSLTNSNSFAGEITALARTGDGTLYIAADNGDPDGPHLYKTVADDLTTFAEIRYEDKPLHVRALAASVNSVHVLEYRETTIAPSGEPLEYLVSNNKGETFHAEGLSPLFANQLFAGKCEGCDPWVLIAHADGITLKARNGLGWSRLAPVEEPLAPPPPPPPPATADADLSLRLVSPSQNSTRIARSTRRFELSLRNDGPDAVTELLVEVQFSTWVDNGGISIKPTQSWGDTATIAGENCQRGYDSYADEMLLCRLETLASGETATIVLVQPLDDATIQLRIDAEVSASYIDDPNGNNDWVIYEASVEENPPGSTQKGSDAGSGGGGSFGLILLFALITASLRRAGLLNWNEPSVM